MFLAFKYRVNLLKSFALGFHPIIGLIKSVCLEEPRWSKRTIRPSIITSHDALIIYIFHPIFPRPIGIMKVKTKLEPDHQSGPKIEGGFTYAKAFSAKYENATPLARME